MKYLIFLLMMASTTAFAGNGNLTGTVSDSTTHEALPGAGILVKVGDKVIKATVSDDEGGFNISLEKGSYEVVFSMVGYNNKVYEVVITADNSTNLYANLGSTVLEPIIVSGVRPIDISTPIQVIDQTLIDNLPYPNVTDIAAVLPGAYQEDYGAPVVFRGSRVGTTLYMVDGMRIIGEPYLPQNAAAEMQVITGGIPAKYGDCTGGVILITTKGYRLY